MSSNAYEDVTDRLAQVLKGADAGAWADLDGHVRGLIRWGDHVPAPGAWLSAATGRRPTDLELTLALCGPDGRTREAALPYVTRTPALLPLLVIRCADWAEPVRQRARKLLGAELPGLSPEALATVAAVVLRETRRLRGEPAYDLLTARLSEAPAAHLLALRAAEDRAVRRLAHRVTVDRALLSPARLAAIAATDPDVIVQDLCANAAIAAGDAVDETVLAPLLGSRTGRVRAAGVTALRRTGRAAEAEPFLYDRSVLVRACARWTLRQTGTDPLPLYRAACAAGDRTPDFAAVGLGECGDRATDAPVLWALIAHERPRVRAGAVAGLRLLDAVRFQRLAPLLDDSSPRVVREAAKALAPWADHFPAGALSLVPGDAPADAVTDVVAEAPAVAPVRAPDGVRTPEPRPWALRVLRLARWRNRSRSAST
ncbi:hypothetical protein ASC82_20080 [Streptomyces sp. Root431]|uniref:HEAT repeat domain-containing protein n=1 Tax=Streptomyces sp. Root431 TaxID=1736535 RepID=UPI0006F58A7B|nr:hypothetical protein [Streptomyces sp. Root431]KQX11187.1 hypothetical protein ASC82_20080 [Streptomyces sp. Root431]